MLKLLFSVWFLGIFTWDMYIQPRSQYGPVYFDDLELRPDVMRLQIPAKSKIMNARLLMELALDDHGRTLIQRRGLRRCSDRRSWDGRTHCMEFDNMVRLEIAHERRGAKSAKSEGKNTLRNKCYTVTWTPLTADFTPQDCIVLKGARWYGGVVTDPQHWPLNDAQLEMKPYAVGYHGRMMERFWLSSKGIGINFHDDIPLHISWNYRQNGGFCFKASYGSTAYKTTGETLPRLKYTICEDSDLVRVYHTMMKTYFPKPETFPSAALLQAPTWFSGFNASMTSADVIQFAKDLRKNGFPGGYFDIGAIALSKPTDDTTKLIETLHKLDIKVIASIVPFVDLHSADFQDGIKRDLFIKSAAGQVPILIKSKSELGVLLDPTKPLAQDWFHKKLLSIQEAAGVDGWRFEPVPYPPLSDIALYTEEGGAGELSNAFIRMSAAGAGGPVVVEEGSRSQGQAVYSSITQHASSWASVESIIPQMLQRHLLGYPLTLPGPIGGTSFSDLPPKELYIRWLQLASYMPAMQFSIAPWQYDGDTVKLARKYVKLHHDTVLPRIQDGLDDYKEHGTPILRPLWWYYPHDPDALTIASEYLLPGRKDLLLVAPILHEGARHRDVYIPPGRWRDVLRGGDVIRGRTWLRNYSVKLSEIATFELVPPE